MGSISEMKSGRRRSFWKCAIFLILQFFLSVSNSQKLSSAYSPKVSIGAVATEVNGPIFYETFIPLIYEYKVPVYKAVDVTLRDWRGKCETDNYAPSYTCPVFYHFERFLERFEQEVVPKAWVDPATNKSTAPSPMMDGSDFCNKIQPHFKGSLTQEFGFEEYIEKLKECNTTQGKVVIERQIGDYVYAIKALFKKMNDNYENEFSNKFFGEANKKFGPAFYVNAVTAHQNGLLIAYLLEKNRWTSAISSCNEQKIPQTLLRPGNITKNLNGLNNRLSVTNQQSALVVDELSSISKLPLTDCSFIERTGHFVVRILIPVISKGISPKLYRINTVPFLVDDEICQLGLQWEESLFLYDEKTRNMQYSLCAETDALCQIKKFQNTVTDLCIRAVFARDHLAAKMYCKENYECVKHLRNSTVMKFPVIQQIYSDAWVVTGTGNASDKLVIKCEGSTAEKKIDLAEEITGALEIRLPCNCHMVFNSEILSPSKPCSMVYNQAPEIRQIIPPHFLTEASLSNPNSTITQHSFDSKFFEHPEPDPDASLIPDNTTTKQSAHTQDEEPRVVQTAGPQLGLLWTVVIFQLILLLAIIGLGFYKYTQYKKEMSYSKERLVYNIYSSPGDIIQESPSNGNGAYRVTTTPTTEYMNHL